MTYNWKNKIILVVEDDQLNYNYLDILLKPTHATVYHAERGEDAIELFRKGPVFDIVLMDIRLPGITGLEATEQILALKKNIPVIAQTAYAGEEDRSAAFAAGCVDFITKPIRADEMLKMMLRYI